MRVIVSCLQIIKTRFCIVVVTSVPERVFGTDTCCTCSADGYIPPGVVGVIYDLRSILVPDPDDVALYVLFKEASIKNVCRIGWSPVSESDGRTVLVIELDKRIGFGLAGEDCFLYYL